MIAGLGSLTLAGTAIASAASVVAGVIATRESTPANLGRVRRMICLTGLLFVAAAALLAAAMWRLDLSIAYVADHCDSTLSPPFRMAALWSGQQGSLLLWATISAVAGAVFSVSVRRARLSGEGFLLLLLAILNLFFAILMLFSADPFTLSASPAAEGAGLNPQLQHWAMIIHPPLLFCGYACSAIPAAVLAAGLWSRRMTGEHLGVALRWTLVGWVFLTAGIALGAWWAYVELGWGGYWAWDPVENASFVPWLTATALLHAIPVQRHRGVLKGWTAGLAFGGFVLCIVGTYITRSGVIESVHAFGRSSVGNSFLVMLIAVGMAGGWLLVSRRAMLRPDRPVDSVLSREGVTLLAILLLTAMAAATLIGTVFPVLSGAAATAAVSVGPAFYNRVVSPLGLAVGMIMAVGPGLIFGPHGPRSLQRAAFWPGIAAAGTIAASLWMGIRSPSVLIGAAIPASAGAGIIASIVESISTYARHTGFGIAASAARVIDSNHRRYGGHLAHLGAGVLVIGIAASSLLSTQVTATLEPGGQFEIAGRTIRFDGLRQVRGPGYVAAEAVLTVNPGGPAEATVLPQRRFYDKAMDAVAEVGIRTTWREDLYIAVLGWEGAGSRVAIQARVNPLVAWIWCGAGLMIGGALFSLVPRLLPRPRAADLPHVPTRSRASGLADREPSASRT